MKSSYKQKDISVSEEKCEEKNYFKTLTYEEALMKIRIRASCVPSVRMHFRNDPAFRKETWSCPECKAGEPGVGGDDGDLGTGVEPRLDTTSHIKICFGYSDLRYGLCLDDDQQLVEYFCRVLERRREKEDC